MKLICGKTVSDGLTRFLNISDKFSTQPNVPNYVAAQSNSTNTGHWRFPMEHIQWFSFLLVDLLEKEEENKYTHT